MQTVQMRPEESADLLKPLKMKLAEYGEFRKTHQQKFEKAEAAIDHENDDTNIANVAEYARYPEIDLFVRFQSEPCTNDNPQKLF
jgi:hypothetical protein